MASDIKRCDGIRRLHVPTVEGIGKIGSNGASQHWRVDTHILSGAVAEEFGPAESG